MLQVGLNDKFIPIRLVKYQPKWPASAFVTTKSGHALSMVISKF